MNIEETQQLKGIRGVIHSIFALLSSKFRISFMIRVSPFLSYLVAILLYTNQDRRILSSALPSRKKNHRGPRRSYPDIFYQTGFVESPHLIKIYRYLATKFQFEYFIFA